MDVDVLKVKVSLIAVKRGALMKRDITLTEMQCLFLWEPHVCAVLQTHWMSQEGDCRGKKARNVCVSGSQTDKSLDNPLHEIQSL